MKGRVMMNREKPLLFALAAASAALLATPILITALVLSPSERKLERMQSDQAAVDVFVGTAEHAPFVNQAAQEAFSNERSTLNPDTKALYTYRSPEGISFISRSAAWDENKLQALYRELLQNKHGKELWSLSEVIVYPQADPFAAATHQNKKQVNTFYLDFPALPKNYGFTLSRKAGVITLYDGDRRDTVASMASSLSHEYGHHYTFYHMFPEYDDESKLLESDYAALRGLDKDKVLIDRSDEQFYFDNHHWYLVELAAEDYVTLMGSPLSREIADFHDVQDYLNGYSGVVYSARNDRVQENLMIPMASEKEGLADYFYRFLDEPAPDLPPRRQIDITVQQGSKSYDLDSGYRTFVHYTLTWNKAYGDDAIYTLVSYCEDDYEGTFYPIKTVRPGQEAVAYIGSVTAEGEQSVKVMEDHLASGTRTFVVTAVLPDGTMHKSDPLRYTF